MTPIEWVVSGGLLGIVGLIWKNNIDMDNKIARSYKRLDEVKDQQEKTYTRKDVCMILHKQIDEKLDNIDTKLDKILANSRH